MASKNDLALAVLEDLEVVAAGENPQAADSQLVIRRYNRLHESWVTQGLAYWESATSAASDTIPDRVMAPLTTLVANACAKAFGKSRDIVEEAKAMNQLSAIVEHESSEQPTQALYY